MKTPLLICDGCGGRNFRRSRRKSVSDLLRMAVGRYPFRCLDCNRRVWVSIWMFSKLAYAKCPKCLNLELTEWDHKRYHHTFWWKLRATFGAHRYRCARCRYNFLSFRPSVAPLAPQLENHRHQ